MITGAERFVFIWSTSHVLKHGSAFHVIGASRRAIKADDEAQRLSVLMPWWYESKKLALEPYIDFSLKLQRIQLPAYPLFSDFQDNIDLHCVTREGGQKPHMLKNHSLTCGQR